MIIVYHNNNRITEVVLPQHKDFSLKKAKNIASGLIQLAEQFPGYGIAWCNAGYKEYLATDLKAIFRHNKMMLSYNPAENDYLGCKIGYAEHLPFIKINKKVTYPTWQMSSLAGIVHASVLLAVKNKIKPGADFDYFLNSVGKIGMPLGLLCYSEPKLLGDAVAKNVSEASSYLLFRFVKQHYKASWVFLLLVNLIVYERKAAFLPFLSALFFKSRNNSKITLDEIRICDVPAIANQASIDVIIPTIGRKKYLYDILCDLRRQTHKPQNVIIVEQDPLPGSFTALDFLAAEKWPFKIRHTFTNQAGVCNARNIALGQIESEWVFLADDDIRIDREFIQETFAEIDKYGAKAVSVNCQGAEETQFYKNVFQWISFGSGCSFVRSEGLKQAEFKMSYEFGYGEDSDFGMQLRNNGYDILYLPKPRIFHLRAPIGGFRHKPALAWENEAIRPKPSPTVMLYYRQHYSNEQLSGYKTTLFFKYYRMQPVKNPVAYFKMFRKQWDKSVFWASQLHQKSTAGNQELKNEVPKKQLL